MSAKKTSAPNEHGNAGNMKESQGLLAKLHALAEKRDDPAVREQLAEGLFNALYDAGERQDFTSIQNLLAELRALAGKHDEPAVRELLAKGLFNALYDSGERQSFASIECFLFELRTLAKTYDEHILRELLAEGIFTAFTYYCKAGNAKGSQGLLAELRALAGKHDEPAVREPLAKGLVNALSDAGERQDFTSVQGLLVELRALAGKHAEPVLRERLAKGLFNAFNDYRNAGNTKESQDLLSELRTLVGKYDEPALREQLAKGLVNALYDSGERQDLTSVQELLAELRTLAEKYDEPALREQLARGLYNASIDAIRIKEDKRLALSFLQEAAKALDIDPENESAEVTDLRAKINLFIKSITPKGGTRNQGAEASQSRTPRSEHVERLLPVIIRSRDAEKKCLDNMAEQKKRIDDFLAPTSNFRPDASVLLILRKWNSFTPIVVDEVDSDKGGGYFVYDRGIGLVIDPGYNFIENFYNACGRITDITHIAVTHAHDDHTAQLEQIFTLLHQYNKQEKDKTKYKKVTLLLGHGVSKKFSGFDFYKNAGYIDRVIILNAFDAENVQKITLAAGFCLTVLPAYHDDIFSADYAIGLGLTVGTRNLLFTSDTSLFPLKVKDGKVVKFTKEPYTEIARVDEDFPEKAIYRMYPEPFNQKPDLLVPHIGSIKEYEFNPSSDMESPMFYPNHLGLLGTFALIQELCPRAVILSEFGSELKGLRGTIQDILQKAIGNGKERVEMASAPFIVPGDTSIVYEISTGKFLCHDSLAFQECCTIQCLLGNSEIGLFDKTNKDCSLEKYKKSLRDYCYDKKENSQHRLPYLREL